MNTLANHTSIVTPAPKGNGSVKTRAKATTAATPVTRGAGMTIDQAIASAREFGGSMAGAESKFVAALSQFATDWDTQAKMKDAALLGYVMRRLGVSEAHAKVTIGKSKFNKNKLDDQHRTQAEESVMGAFRTLWSRALAMADIELPQTPGQISAAKKREENAEAKKALDSAKDEAYAVVNPTAEVDVYDAVQNMVRMLQSYHNKHADKFQGDTGSAWREWIFSAPVAR